MEMSFVEQEDVLRHLEKLFKYIFKHSMNIEFDDRFPRITWKTAMDKYGSDKPDLRFDLPIVDITEVARVCEFSVFRNVVDQGGVVRAICIKGGDVLSRSQIDELTKTAVTFGAKGMAWISLRPDGEIYSILKKYFNESDIQAIIEKTEAKNGDFILFCADKLDIVRKVLGVLRLEIADIFNLRRKDDYKILFVTDFPQFEYSEEEGRYLAMHHPFTMPYLEDISLIETDKGAVRAQAYDVVLNGVELGSGSVRIYDADIQQKMFSALGFSEEEIKERFGFMVDAFKYGTPPHAGFAFGLDRLVMLLVGANSLREVIAFPKTKDASCLMTNAPNLVDDEQLEVLNLGLYTAEGVVKKKAKSNDVDVDVDKVAALAMISIKEEEKEKLKDDLLSIIEFANQLKEADTSNIKLSTAEVTNVLRTDVVTNINRRDEMLSNAKTKENGMILIKKVIE